jgi:hypothetical protein
MAARFCGTNAESASSSVTDTFLVSAKTLRPQYSGHKLIQAASGCF